FAAFLVGDNEASFGFLKLKEKTAKELGIDFRVYRFPDDVKNGELREKIGIISGHKNCGGAILQLPLPGHLNPYYALNVIPPAKDIDVIGERTLGAFYNGRSVVLPPAVSVLEEILKREKFDLSNKKVAVVGLGFLVGKPISLWLEGKCAEIYLLDKGSDFKMLKEADLVVLGVGKSGLIDAQDIGRNAAVIDFGYSFDGEGKIKGDFNPEGADGLIFYTPTPGGTGPILIAELLKNFFILNEE
ncbi:MAG: bifunctional 5,10-methylenetetrahydrofolate dehydrogenase/5,10-methenyltetrahydrofolate cyclohydrolase, partial [Patescibacteria group bacterium]|nr:bifunctional 5,10-methylenetetrahydrofolate dehydrogenase/5,10-methenyltetrahydrofolate cyclohydrolase [Patescibacteria group bacterium]